VSAEIIAHPGSPKELLDTVVEEIPNMTGVVVLTRDRDTGWDARWSTLEMRDVAWALIVFERMLLRAISELTAELEG